MIYFCLLSAAPNISGPILLNRRVKVPQFCRTVVKVTYFLEVKVKFEEIFHDFSPRRLFFELSASDFEFEISASIFERRYH